MTRLQNVYEETVKPALVAEFGYKNPMEIPRIVKIVVNMGVGEATQDSKKMDVAADLRARMMTGFCPAIRAISSAATSIFLLSWAASPTPMLTTILTMRGISIGFLYPTRRPGPA